MTLKNQNKRSKKLSSAPSKKGIYLSVMLLTALAVAQILVCSFLANLGNQLKNLERSQAKIETENRALKKDLASQTSLSQLQDQAESRGFKEPKLWDLSGQPPVAMNK